MTAQVLSQIEILVAFKTCNSFRCY